MYIFAAVIRMNRETYLLYFPAELVPRKGFCRANLISAEYAHKAQTSP